MIDVQEISSLETLRDLKTRYLQQTTAPLDGMWLNGFVPMAKHFGFYQDEYIVGYFCVNDEGYLLQFILDEDHHQDSAKLFGSLFHDEKAIQGKVNGAFASTAEPNYLSLCLDTFSNHEVNALMYELAPNNEPAASEDKWKLRLVESPQLEEAIEFAVDAIGAPEQWLRGYYTNLISREELYGVWQEGQLIATGENRGNDDTQVEYTDVGVIVAPSQRAKGVATNVLQQLVAMNSARDLQSICSTEKSNLAAQKAITRAGFVTGNRIVQFT